MLRELSRHLRWQDLRIEPVAPLQQLRVAPVVELRVFLGVHLRVAARGAPVAGGVRLQAPLAHAEEELVGIGHPRPQLHGEQLVEARAGLLLDLRLEIPAHEGHQEALQLVHDPGGEATQDLDLRVEVHVATDALQLCELLLIVELTVEEDLEPSAPFVFLRSNKKRPKGHRSWIHIHSKRGS